ncbi:hypothetical protein AGOR_G00120240 [Albula goreensis]|uniref:Uncharacterized protein n=1 Tax=Albula goreensis TaxID=1534307 RepID=A0A8T3DC58_9TELE|nr:hypothetical protein AGOR_G00120240 [Albula goreensis]
MACQGPTERRAQADGNAGATAITKSPRQHQTPESPFQPAETTTNGNGTYKTLHGSPIQNENGAAVSEIARLLPDFQTTMCTQV